VDGKKEVRPAGDPSARLDGEKPRFDHRKRSCKARFGDSADVLGKDESDGIR
jgi:hypothetical protein